MSPTTIRVRAVAALSSARGLMPAGVPRVAAVSSVAAVSAAASVRVRTTTRHLVSAATAPTPAASLAGALVVIVVVSRSVVVVGALQFGISTGMFLRVSYIRSSFRVSGEVLGGHGCVSR